MTTYADAIAALQKAADGLDDHDRKQLYWATLCRLAKSLPAAVAAAVQDDK